MRIGSHDPRKRLLTNWAVRSTPPPPPRPGSGWMRERQSQRGARLSNAPYQFGRGTFTSTAYDKTRHEERGPMTAHPVSAKYQCRCGHTQTHHAWNVGRCEYPLWDKRRDCPCLKFQPIPQRQLSKKTLASIKRGLKDAKAGRLITYKPIPQKKKR